MADKPQIGLAEDVGTTTQYAGTVGTTAILIPSVAGGAISSFLVRCPSQSGSPTKSVSFSFDNVTYQKLNSGEALGWSPMGNIQQIYIKGSGASILYEVIINREPS